MRKKIVLIVCIILIVCCGGVYLHDEIKAGQTVAGLNTDTTNTIITGIWDDENLSKYKHLAIPDATAPVRTGALGTTFEQMYAKVTDIGEGAFQGNMWIESVYIPVNIVRIQKNAFNGCNSISSISYAGTEEQWKQIVIELGNEVLQYIPIEYNATMPRTKDLY